ncbi:hypothetical protein M8J75_008776 [Diaphorina citri]|nr:hypothetical protein M8J75_008776 [Diaphorina citri]
MLVCVPRIHSLFLVCSGNSQLILVCSGNSELSPMCSGKSQLMFVCSRNSNKRGAGDRRKVKIKIQKMKPRRNAATTGARNSTLQTVRTLPDISECSSDNLLEQLKYFAENPVDNLDMIVSISSRLYLKITSQDKTSKDKVLDKIRRGKREFYPLFLKLIERDLCTSP